MWRTPRLGELTNRLWRRWMVGLALRESRGDWSAPPAEFVDEIWDHLDAGTFDAILRLYRSGPEDKLERLGERLGTLTAPALVAWAGTDRYLPARFGPLYAEALPNAELVEFPRYGHWPWLEGPEVIPRVVEFLERA